MNKILEFLPGAAFWVLALAAQVSGFTSSIVAATLALIGALMLSLATFHHVYRWHIHRTAIGRHALDSWYLIGTFTFIGMLAISVAAFGLGARATAATKEEKPSGAGAQKTNVESSPLKDIDVTWGIDGTIWLTGVYTRSGTNLTAYVAGYSPETFNTTIGAPRRDMWAYMPSAGVRSATSSEPKFSRDTQARIRIGSLSEIENRWMLVAGDKRVGTYRGGFLGVISLSTDQQENAGRIPFAIVSRATVANTDAIPILIGPRIINFQLSMLAEEAQ